MKDVTPGMRIQTWDYATVGTGMYRVVQVYSTSGRDWFEVQQQGSKAVAMVSTVVRSRYHRIHECTTCHKNAPMCPHVLAVYACTRGEVPLVPAVDTPTGRTWRKQYVGSVL